VEVENEQYCYQLMGYAYLTGKPKGYLVFIDKATYGIKQVLVVLQFWQERIEDELTILRNYWEQDKLPPAMPRAYGGKECRYCSFKDKCDAYEAAA